MEWYRNDKAAVAEALRRGERPDLATTMASGPLDELVALHEELGILAILDQVEVQRERAGVPDTLLVRTLATLPFVEQASLSGGSSVLFREPAVLLQLGWAPVQIRAGSNGRHRHPQGSVSATRPIIVAWRLLAGPASEKGKEAQVTRTSGASLGGGRAAGDPLTARRCALCRWSAAGLAQVQQRD